MEDLSLDTLSNDMAARLSPSDYFLFKVVLLYGAARPLVERQLRLSPAAYDAAMWRITSAAIAAQREAA
jgi:hypothetical protein